MQTTTPLTGKYARLRDDLRKAYHIGLEAAALVSDGGTCNLDAPALILRRWNHEKVNRAAREAGGGSYTWSCYGGGCHVFCFPVGGQAYKRETAARAMTEALAAMGYEALTYCQID